MTIQTKWIIGIIIAILVIGGVVLASNNRVNQGAGDTSPIKIGFVGPLSGDAASLGEPMLNAIKLAVEEINTDGGVSGRQVELVVEDGKCDPKESLTAARKVIDVDQIKIIISICSGEVLSIARVAEENEVLVITPAGTSPEISHAGDMVFRNTPSDDGSAVVLSSLALSNNHKKVGIISEQTDFAQAFASAFIEQFEGQGGVVVSESFSSETTDFRSILTKIKSAEVDALLVNPQTEIAGGNIIHQSKDLGLQIPLYANQAAGGAKSIEIARGSAEGMYIVDAPGLSSSNQIAVRLLDKYRERHGTPVFEYFLGSSYDIPYLVAEAIENVGDDSQDIKEYFYDLSGFNGAIGTYSFDENGDVEGIEFIIKQVVDGVAVPVQ